MLSLEKRAENYSKIFPDYPPVVSSKGWLYGIWMIGNYYKRKHGYYGEYPPSYLKRVYSLFKDCSNVLHLFSGTVEKNLDYKHTTFDINKELNPDIVGDVKNIKEHFKENQFDLILADTPYEKKDFAIYGYKPFSKQKVVKDLYHISNGFLVWLDLIVPIYSKEQWKMIGSIGLLTGTNRRVRIVSIFQKNIKTELHKKETRLFKYFK